MVTTLDTSQRAFCEAPEGHIRLLAPAGCGKTQCLLLRSKHLIAQAQGQPPRIRIVTFTRAARDELRDRLAEIELGSVEVTTLNSWGFQRIRDASTSPKLITTRADYHFAMLNQLQPVWQRKKHKHIREAITASPWSRANAPRMLMDMIDAFKSLGFDHKRCKTEEQFLLHWNYLESQHLQWMMLTQARQLCRYGVLDDKHLDSKGFSDAGKRQMYNRFYQFWRDATKHLHREATFTIEDQKYHAFQDERERVENRDYLQGAARRQHILVDEFQDINPLDLALIKAMVERNHAWLTISGDDDQAIFEWRGATPEYIIDPSKFFGSQFSTYLLDTNYRSPANIVQHSQELIRHNQRREKKKIKPFNVNVARIDQKAVESVSEALEFVHNLVSGCIEHDDDPSRIAIIGRKRAQIIPYQVYFASRDIHFSAAEDLQVFLTRAFDQLLDLLEIKSSNVPRSKIIATTLKLCGLVKRYPLNKTDSERLRRHLGAERPRSMEAALDRLSSYTGSLKGGNAGGATSRTMADALRAFLEATSVSETLEVLGSNFEGLQYDFGKAEEDVFFTDPPFLYLAQYASTYGDDFEEFVEDIDKARDTLVHVPPFEEDADGETPPPRPVHLMTALRSKGKEFDIVVLLDVVDGIWPNKNAETTAQLESERRVFYVAFTRAKERVVLLMDPRHAPSSYISELGLASDNAQENRTVDASDGR